MSQPLLYNSVITIYNEVLFSYFAIILLPIMKALPITHIHIQPYERVYVSHHGKT